MDGFGRFAHGQPITLFSADHKFLCQLQGRYIMPQNNQPTEHHGPRLSRRSPVVKFTVTHQCSVVVDVTSAPHWEAAQFSS